MKIKRVSGLIVCCLLLTGVLKTGVKAEAGATESAVLHVVATTTLLGSIADRVGASRTQVTTLVPGGMCPGHFDLSPGTVASLEKADILVRHGFERWVDDLLGSAGNRTLQVVEISGMGNCMIPENYHQAIDTLTAVLCRADTAHCSRYTQSGATYRRMVTDTLHMLRERIGRRFEDYNAIASHHQKAFMEWLGFSVVATFGRKDDMSANSYMDLIETAGEKNVALVVDNMQSGPDVGKQIAKETPAHHIVLSNFVLHDSYIGTVIQNVTTVEEAIQHYEQR